MTAKTTINMSLDAIEKGAKALVTSATNNKSRSQALTIAALIHLGEHGNVRVLEKLYKAIGLVFGKAKQDTWREYVVHHSWLVFNPHNLSASKLKATLDSNFVVVFVKDRSKAMDIDTAKGVNWWNHERDAPDAKPANAEATVAAFVKRLNKLMADGKLIGTDGKPVSLADLRSMVKRSAEALEYKVTVSTNDGNMVDKVNPVGATADTQPNVPVVKRKRTNGERKAAIAAAKDAKANAKVAAAA